MKERFEKAKTFVVDHKKEIGGALLVVAGTVVGYKIIKSIPGLKAPVETVITKIENLEIPKLDIGVIDDLWSDEFGKNLILNDITVADMGKIGEEFLKIDGVKPDTVVTAVVGLLDKVETVS